MVDDMTLDCNICKQFESNFGSARSLNSMLTGGDISDVLQVRQGYSDGDKCICGRTQDEAHLLACPDLEITCTAERRSTNKQSVCRNTGKDQFSHNRTRKVK